MKVRALKSFAGKVSMGKGSVRDISDKAILKDLLKAGYVEKLTDKEPEEGGDADETQRTDS